jgi:hypothetical protein
MMVGDSSRAAVHLFNETDELLTPPNVSLPVTTTQAMRYAN